MKTMRVVGAAIAFVLAITFSLRGQATVTAIPAGTVSLSATNIRMLGTLSDAQLGEFLNVLAATPTIAAEDLPRGGMAGFYSLAHPNWPPLPADIRQVPVWKLNSDSGAGFYLLDDLDYPESSAAGGMMAMDAPGPPGFGDGGGTNSGGGFSSNFQPQVFTTNDLWLQIVGTTNTGTGLTANLTIHTPWNDTNLTHDLFYTTNLASPIHWHFLMRCISTNVIVPGLCDAQGFFRLGQTNGDLTVTTNATPQQLAQLLVPPWVTVSNATYTGELLARGTFAGGNGCGLPIDSGVILSSGDITNAIGPNNLYDAQTKFNGNGDPDLDNLVGGDSTTEDAAVLEFDMVSTNSFTLQFQYIFASEEYPEYVGTRYDDPMAIFVSTNRVGTNWINSITNDIALVPGTTNVPVSVNTINGGYLKGNISPTNPQFYVDNHDPNPNFSAVPPYAVDAPVFNIQYDGMTVLLTAQTQISPGIPCHVKIAIADAGDPGRDSAVFIKAWSPCQCQ